MSIRFGTKRIVVLNDTRVDNHHGCSAVMNAIHSLSRESGMSVIASAPAHKDWRESAFICKAIDDADCIIVNGEGTIHSDRLAGRWLLQVGPYAKKRGKPAALINATWHANSKEFARLAGEFAILSVRESASARELNRAGVTCRVVPDLALHSRPPYGPDRVGIGYTDCVVSSRALALYDRMRVLGAEPISMFYDRQSGRDVVASLRRFAGHSRQLRLERALSALRGVLIDYKSQIRHWDAFVTKVAGKRLIVTGRFHMLIFCLATRTPFLAIESNTHKNSATVADAGVGTWRTVTFQARSRVLQFMTTQVMQ